MLNILLSHGYNCSCNVIVYAFDNSFSLTWILTSTQSLQVTESFIVR